MWDLFSIDHVYPSKFVEDPRKKKRPHDNDLLDHKTPTARICTGMVTSYPQGIFYILNPATARNKVRDDRFG